MINGNEINHEVPVHIKDCRHGRFCYWLHDHYIGGALERYGEYSEAEVDFFGKILKREHVVVEVGSNIGCHTIPLAKMAGRVHAFEPQRPVFQLLNANVALNGLLNVWTYPMACGAAQTQMHVPDINYREANNFGGVSLAAGMGGMNTVPVVRMDDAIPVAHFLKIDCEGMELDVLKGATNIITTQRPVMYVENDREEKSPPLIEWLLQQNYSLWWHLPQLFNPNNFLHNSNNDLYGYMVSVNMLCVPKEFEWSIAGLREIKNPEDKCSAAG